MNFLKRLFNFSSESHFDLKEVKNNILKIDYNPDNVQIISIPDIDNQNFKVSKWFCKVGDVIEVKGIICELKGKKITMEFESFVSCRLVSIVASDKILKTNDEICRIEKF